MEFRKKISFFFFHFLLTFFVIFFFREIREYKSRVESYSREMLRKEAQCRDLQQRLENGEGSKCINVINANSLMRIEIALIRKKMITIATIKLKLIGVVGAYYHKKNKLQSKKCHCPIFTFTNKFSFFLFFSSSTTLYSCFRSTLFLDFDGL